MKVLVRATNWIGDAVMSLPALRAIRRSLPGAEITVLARPWVAALYEAERSVDHVIPLEGTAGPRDWTRKLKTVRALRAGRFDLAILFPNSFESAAIAFAAGVPKRVGYAKDGRRFLLTHPIEIPRAGEVPRHERFYYLELLRRAGLIAGFDRDEAGIFLDGADASRARGQALFEARGLPLPIVGISPGAAYGTAKRWLPERFAESARELAGGIGGSVAVFGATAEADLCEAVARQCGGTNFAGKTSLREFIDMTAACDIFLTNDSGAMHIAAALGVPSVTVFGPTDETGTGPSGSNAVIVREPVACAPCKLRECPIDHRCMTGVNVHRVVAAGVRLRGCRKP